MSSEVTSLANSRFLREHFPMSRYGQPPPLKMNHLLLCSAAWHLSTAQSQTYRRAGCNNIHTQPWQYCRTRDRNPKHATNLL